MEDPFVAPADGDGKPSPTRDRSSTASSCWNCANCHSVVYSTDERCPTCHGLQVKIRGEQREELFLTERWLHRLSPTTTAPRSSTSSPLPTVSVNELPQPEELTTASESEGQIDELGFSISSRDARLTKNDTDGDNYNVRLVNPVASMLAAAPSPSVFRKPTIFSQNAAPRLSASPLKEPPPSLQFTSLSMNLPTNSTSRPTDPAVRSFLKRPVEDEEGEEDSSLRRASAIKSKLSHEKDLASSRV